MFLLKMIVCCVFLAITGSSTAAEATEPNYVVPILDLEGDTIASAALLSPTQMLTAAHAVEGLHEFVFLKCGKDLMFGYVTKFDVVADLALIDTLMPCTTVTLSVIAEKNPEEGTTILVQGYPAGGPRRTTVGVVSGYDKLQFQGHSFKDRFVMISDVLIAGGNSGGPAMAEGFLIGIVQAKMCFNTPRGLTPACYSILAPPSTINEFLHAATP